jgi:7-carboxy-7-deazaguanine synthase
MQTEAPARVREKEEFLLNEMYVSIQGESSLVGLPTIFVRLYTCNLRCLWCDSMYAVEGGEFTRASVPDVVARVRGLARPTAEGAEGIHAVCWTGGEPLLQARAIAAAVRGLPDAFLHSIETDGEVDVRPFDDLVREEREAGRVRYVMDVKCPGSGMKADLVYANLGRLHAHDEVKFVLRTRDDYDFAKRVLSAYPTRAGTILFSPVVPAHKVSQGLGTAELAGWILEDRLPVRLQVQLHKMIWPDRARGI